MNIFKTFAFFVLFLGTKSFAQNIAIDYSNTTSNNLSASSTCNVFNQSGNDPKVNGIKHYPVSGGATFDGTSINMKTTKNSNVDNGTAYAIAYNFKVGYNYVIAIDLGYSSNPITSAVIPSIDISLRTDLPDRGDTDPTACEAVSGSKYASSRGVNVVSITLTQKPVKTYTITTFSVNPAQKYMVVTVYFGADEGSNVKVNKIGITETAQVAPVSFTLPSNTPITCGSSTPQTFAITNVNGTTGITNYTWNLGTNNGWLLSTGVPASATVPGGLLSSITLTPVCGSTQSSITATVTANGTAYNTNAAAVAYSKPSLSVVGSSYLGCTASNYSISSLPCNASITWSLSDQTMASIAAPQNLSTCTVAPAMSGTTSLIATVGLGCSVTPYTYSLPLSIMTGPYQVTEISPSCAPSFSIYVTTNGNSSGNPPVPLTFTTQPAGAATFTAAAGYPAPTYSQSFYTVTRAGGFYGTFKIFAQKTGSTICESGISAPTKRVPPTFNCNAFGSQFLQCNNVIPMCASDFNKGFPFTLPAIPAGYPDALGWYTYGTNCTIKIVNGKYYAIPTATGLTQGYTANTILSFLCPYPFPAEPIKWIATKPWLYPCSTNPNYPYPYTTGRMATAGAVTGVDNSLAKELPVESADSKTIIFPNPATGSEFTVSFDQMNAKMAMNKKGELGEIRIETMSGKFISATPIVANTYQININIANVPNGLYLVTITRGTTSETKKLIIAR